MYNSNFTVVNKHMTNVIGELKSELIKITCNRPIHFSLVRFELFDEYSFPYFLFITNNVFTKGGVT